MGATLLRVDSTTPADGSLVSLPFTTLDVHFNEPFDPATVSASNLTISQGTVTAATVVDATTARYTLAGISTETTVTVALAAGALKKLADGMPMVSYSGSFVTDIGTVALPATTGLAPSGSLIYRTTGNGTIGLAGDTDSFTINLDAGQCLSVAITSGSTLRSTLQVMDPSSNVLGSATASAVGGSAILQGLPAAAAGIYTITVGGAAASTGAYNVEATLNAAVETETYGGAADDTRASAQNIDSSFVTLDGVASRGAVVGVLPSTSSNDWYSFNLNSGHNTTLVVSKTTASTNPTVALYDAGGNLLATGAAGATNVDRAIVNFVAPASGTYYALVSGSNGEYSLVATRNALFDLEPNDGTPQAQTLGTARGALGYIEKGVSGVEPDNYAVGTVLTNLVPGVTLSVQGSTAAVTSQTGAYASTGTRVFAYGTAVDWYSSSVWLRADFATPTSSVSIDIVPNDTYDPGIMRAYDAAGNLLQEVTCPPPTLGSFTTLSVNRPAADIACILAAGLSGDTALLDHLVVGGMGNGQDYYSISLTAGDILACHTSTPGGASGEFANTLEPALGIYDPSGNLVAANDNGASDGRNAMIAYTVPVSGTYKIRVYAMGGTTGEYVLSLGDALVMGASANVREGDGTATATITATTAPDHDATITLTSSDPGRLAVLPTVVLPAGQASISVPLNIIDNSLLDGWEMVSITASAAGYFSSNSTITVHDNETAALSVSLPSAAREGDGSLPGTITSSAAPTRDIVVQLSSNLASRLTVPATVTIPAGQTSVSFNATVVDNSVIDGTQNALVSAAVENWTNVAATVSVADNDGYITVTLPASGWEGQSLSNAGTVRLGGTLPTSLVVTLTSSDVTALTLPATVTIAAGQTSGSFTATLVNDGLKAGTRTGSVTATAAGLTSGSASIVVHDSTLDHLTIDPITSPKTAGVAFASTLRAYNVANEVIPVYTATGSLSASGQAGSLPISPASTTFAAGVWTGNVTIAAVDPTAAFTIISGGVAAASNTFALQAGPVASFQSSTVPTPQVVGIPFPVTVTARDANGFLANSFNGIANLSGMTGTTSSQTMLGTVTSNFGGSAGAFTMGYAFTPNIPIQVTHVRSFFGTKVSIWTSTGTLLASQNVSGSGGTWTETALATPLQLQAGVTYRITSYSPVLQVYYWRSTAPVNPGFATLGQTYEVAGDAFPTNTDSNYWLVDLRANVTATTPVTPVAASFVNGVWTGSVTVPQVAGSMYLQVTDGSSHTGISNTFSVIPPTVYAFLPANVSENDGVVNGTLTVAPVTGSDLVVTLASSDPGRLSVPSTITIPAGKSSVPLPLTVLDNSLLDGLENVIVAGSAGGYMTAGGTVTLHDSEWSALAITIPASASEGSGTLAGTITAAAAPDRDITIQLSSSNLARLTVPATVTLRAGQTTASFNATVLDNTVIDGTQNALITAAVDKWTSGTANVLVLDNDGYVALSLPAGGWEGQSLSSAGTVRLGGTLPSALTVYLFSSDTTALTVPLTVSIPAGQTSATFTITWVQDGFKAGSRTATATAAATGLTISMSNIVVHDSTLDRLVIDPITGPKLVGVPFGATVGAYNIVNELIANYAATGSLTAAGQAGSLAVTPAAISFNSGIWAGSVTITAMDPAAAITVTSGGVAATSNAFALQAGPVANFQWSTISSPQGLNIPFRVTLSAKDAFGNPVTNFNGSVTLSGMIGSMPPTNSGTTYTGAKDFTSTPLSLGIAADGSFVGPTIGAKNNGVEYLRYGSYLAGFTVAYNGVNYTNDIAAPGSPAFPVTLEDFSSGALHGVRITGTIATSLGFQRTIWWYDGNAYALVATTLTNKSTSSLTGVALLDNQDPDPAGTTTTSNDVVIDANGHLVVGSVSGIGGMALASLDSRAVASAGNGFTITTPWTVINSPTDPNGASSDTSINLAFNVGTLALGQSTTTTFAMRFGSTPAAIQVNYAAIASQTSGFTPVSIAPTSATFVNGIWTGNVTVPQPGTGLHLHAADAAGHAGDSNTFNVIPLTLSFTLPSSVHEGDGTASP